MENASKALLIAGELLIGVIILTILSLVFRNVSTVSESYQDRINQQKINSFNMEFQQFVTTSERKLYATDIISLINKVENWNKDIGHDAITMELYLLNRVKVKIDENGITPNYNEKNFIMQYNGIGQENSIERYKFNCEISYNENTGKVDRIKAEVIER